MPSLIDTKDALSHYDGKNMTVLSELAVVKSHGDGLEIFLDELSLLAGDSNPSIADGATWILYQHMKKGNSISEKQKTNIVNNALKTTSWAAKLHLCQSMRFLLFSNSEVRKLMTFLEPLLCHRRPFLRAWSLDALCHLANQHANLLPMAKEALSNASQDSAGSVRTRARNIKLKSK